MRAVVVVVLLLLACGTACSSSHTPSSRVPTRAEAARVLDAYAKAVLARSETSFDALLDPAPASGRFRAEQRTTFANLADVPLALWSYTELGTIEDKASLQASHDQYASPTLLLHVTLDYELKGIDTVPSEHDQYLVFTERGGRTYLAGDDAESGLGGTTWYGPWHYGPLAAVRGQRTLVLGPPGDRALLQTLATETDQAVTAVTAFWGTHWAQRVAVLVPHDRAEFTALTGEGITDVSAAAIDDGTGAGSDPPAGQRLVLNPSQLGMLSAVGRGIVLRHEVTHLASAADTADITPRWLVEGLAEYVANLDTGQSVRTAASELARQVRAGALPTALPGDDAFASASALAYEQAWLACRLIASRVGPRGLLQFYRAVGTALEPAGPALTRAFATVLHETPAAFTAQWRTYLERELG